MIVLLLLTGLGFYLELTHPGLIIPAVVGAISLLLLLIASSVLPLSVVGVGLLVLAFALLIGEIYVSSFGVLAAAGIVLFVTGAYLLFDPETPGLQVPRFLIWGSTLGLSIVAGIIAVAVGKTLHTPQTAGAEGMLGAKGTVCKSIIPGEIGSAFVNGEYWNAKAYQSIEAGTPVVVVAIKGLLIHVEKCD